MVEALRNAVGMGELRCHYQPKVDTATGQVVGAEALVRWQHPVSGLLAPADFLPLAEQAGLMRPITESVLDMALGECRRWHSAGNPIGLAVNVSVTDLLDPTLPRRVVELLARMVWKRNG